MSIIITKILKAVLPYGIVRIIEGDGYGRLKYIGYRLPAFGGMKQFAAWIKKYSVLEVKNIFEIGANFAQDADYLRSAFKLSAKDVYVFEAHPDLYSAIKKIHKFNAFNYAVFNEEKDMPFNN